MDTPPGNKSTSQRTRGGAPCPKCGSTVTGKFCAECGAALAASCAHCGATLPPGSRFCVECGAPAAAGAGPAAGASGGGAETIFNGSALRWAIPAIVLTMLIAFLIGQRVSAPATTTTASAGMDAPFANGGTGVVAAPDISNMSPEERAQRLFDRIMRYAGTGDVDSARFFAPMALQSYEMLSARDAHWHYDIGMIGLATADSSMARAEADTVLKMNPTHLLGLLLAMRAANSPAARANFANRFLSAQKSESGRKLSEYVEHASDIDAGAAEARRDAGKPR